MDSRLNRITQVLLIAFKWVGIIVLSLVVVLLVIRGIGRRINKRIPEGGINASMYVDVNDSKQWINIYGQDMSNPVLLYLHGGPGSATSLFDYAFTRKWSDVFTVVTWDQRGCGKSFDKSRPQTITAEIMMSAGFMKRLWNGQKMTRKGAGWSRSGAGAWNWEMRT